MADSKRQTTSDDWGRPTRWTLIRRASTKDTAPEAVEAWEDLIERYGDPVRKAVGRMLRHHPQADDLATDFFAYLYSKDVLVRAEPDRGRFRCFIQGVIKRYVLNETKNRGGVAVPVDDVQPSAPPEADDAEAREEAEWAMTVLKNATTELLKQYPRDGELLLRAFGIAPYEPSSRKALCEEMGMQKSALNVAIHRAQKRLKHLIKSEVRETVDSDDDFMLETAVIRDRLMSCKPELFHENLEFADWDGVDDDEPAAPDVSAET